MDRLERNKQTAMAFYDLMFNRCKPREAVERYTGGVYIQHNPGVGDGKEAFITYFERNGYLPARREWESGRALGRAAGRPADLPKQ